MKLLPLALAVLLVVAGVPAPTAAADDGRPLAEAGLDQSTTVGSTVYLDGGGSLDPDGEIVEYRWSIRAPDGGTVTPADPDAVTTRFVPDETGRYEVELTVTGDDGQRHSDTLYVDVAEANERPPTATPTATPAETSTPEPTAESGTTPTGGDAPTPDAPNLDPNRAPTGEVQGPSSVTSGSTVSYTIDARDPDGEIVDRWWLPSSLTSAGQSDLRSSIRTVTVDATPGTSADVAAIVVDDDGAATTLTKTVEVRNALPSASIEGDSTAVVNTTEEYRVVASDPDGVITSVSLSSGSGAVEPVGSTSGETPTSSGEWARSFRFTEIPSDDGTVTIEATVRDEYGGVTRVQKEVTVVGGREVKGADPLSQSAPEILSLDVTLEDGPDGINGRQALFSAVASDRDSSRLTFEWRIGDVALLRNRATGSPARAEISYALEDQQIEAGEVDVTLRVSDQNGNQRSLTRTLEVERSNPSGGTYGRAYSAEITSVLGRTVQGQFSMKRSHAGEVVVVNFGDGHSDTISLGGTTLYHFSHEYRSAGRYAISVNPGWSPDVASVPVNVSQQTYSVFEYDRRESTIHRTAAAESPGSNWTRDGIARIEREQVGIDRTRTLADGGKALTSPGQDWSRVGTTTEYHTELRTTESTSSPGSQWTLAERNIGQKEVFSEWQQTTVPQRGLLGSDWEYVNRVPYTVHRTETEESTDRPGGDDWTRGGKVGKTQVDYRTEWVDYQFHADADWQYLGADRYVSGYDTTTRCIDYIQLYRTRHCLERETERNPEYDYRYEYRVPVYDTVYEWTRTVEETAYEYRYRSATYTTEAVNEYEKEVRVGTEYVQWERPEIERTTIYRWKMTEYSWEGETSFSEPIGDVRNLTRVVKECGTEPNEPMTCERGS